MKKKSLSMMVGVAVLTFFLVIAGSGMSMAMSKKYVVGWNSAPQAGTNPFNMRILSDYVFLPYIYEPLMINTWSGEHIPWLAESITYSEKTDTWDIKIRENAKWHDGMPVTAADLKYTMEMAYKYNATSGNPTKKYVEWVMLKDEKTAAVKLNTNLAGFAAIFAQFSTVPKHIWEKVEGDVTKHVNPNPIGSGPFKFREYVHNSHLTMDAFKDHWRGTPHIDELTVRIYSNSQAMGVAFKKGELDLLPDLGGIENVLKVLEKDKNAVVKMGTTNNILYIAVNQFIEPLKVKEFRQALDMTIPKEKIVKIALAGRADLPLMGYQAPVNKKWANTSLRWQYLGDSEKERIEKANSLLDNLGWTMGNDGVRVTSEGDKLEFTIFSRPDPTFIRAAEMIVTQWKKIGVSCKVEVHEPRSLYVSIVYNGEKTQDWNFMIHRSVLRADPEYFASDWATESDTFWSSCNALGWKNAEAQKLLRDSRRELDESKRVMQVMRAQELFAEDLPVLSIAHKHMGFAYRSDRFRNINTEPTYTSDIALHEVMSMVPK